MGINCPNIFLIRMQNVSGHTQFSKMYIVKYYNKYELFKKQKMKKNERHPLDRSASRWFLQKPRKHLYLSSFPSLSPAWLVTRLIHDWPSFARRFDLSILLQEKRGKVWWCNRDEFRSGTRPEARWQKGRSTLVVTHARTVYAPPLGRWGWTRSVRLLNINASDLPSVNVDQLERLPCFWSVVSDRQLVDKQRRTKYSADHGTLREQRRSIDENKRESCRDTIPLTERVESTARKINFSCMNG